MALLSIAVLGVLVVAVISTLAPRLGVAAPLLLLVVGVVVGLLPMVPTVRVGPDVILVGVLPPLLYAAAVGLPAMDFRRDLAAISGLSVVLVALSSLVLGLLVSWLVPGVGLALGIALGAVLSPTDAVATSIVKRLGAPPRLVTVLEGEGLINDATALVVLRSAIVATGASVTAGEVVGDFARAVAVAVAVGALVGWLHLRVREHVAEPAVGTAISFTVPFLAYLPSEHLGGSGLVAVVAAGLVYGQGAPRRLHAQHRLAEEQNWRTVELLLEGAVFVLMGLELDGLLRDLRTDDVDVWTALGLAGVLALAAVLVRAAYVAPLLVGLERRARRGRELVEQMRAGTGRFAADRRRGPGAGPGREPRRGPARRPRDEERASERFLSRMRSYVADIDYLTGAPMGVREGTLLVWAGMRGVVTLAAAQTLPADVPHRPLLVLTAFMVAVGTLVVQGGTLPWVVRRLGLRGSSAEEDAAERTRLNHQLEVAAARALAADDLSHPDGTPYDPAILAAVRERAAAQAELDDPDDRRHADVLTLRAATVDAMRAELLRARAEGTYSSRTLTEALGVLDAEQIGLDARRRTYEG